jgi:hypothetical protein
MMNIIESIFKGLWNYIKSDSRVVYWIIILILIIVLIFTSKSCQNAKFESEIAKQNIVALQDTLRVEKNKNGENQYLKLSLLSNIDDLKNLNKSLYEEVQKIDGKVLAMSKTIVTIKGTLENVPQDRTSDSPITLKNDTLTANYKYQDSGKTWNRSIVGKSVLLMKNVTDSTYAQPLYDVLSEDRMNLTVFASIRKRESDDMYEYVLRTDYPNAKLDVEGFIDPKMFNNDLSSKTEDKWIIGPYVGVGVINNLSFTPTFGIGLTYKILGF